jgi:FtsH-binding integral membrane protein
MAVGLSITGFVAYFVAHNPALLQLIYGNPIVQIGLFIGTLGMVFYISARIQKIKASTATGLFLLYSALMGVMLSFIFVLYTQTSIASTFFVCAATFVAISIYGYTTKRDLTSLGSFMFMGLIGIIIATVVNIFLRSPAMHMVISYIGVIVFIGLTAYDTQHIKNMALTQPAGLDAGVVRKGAILGALKLYLDFINLFLMLLRIFGNRE